MKVKFGKAEKKMLCIELADYLPQIRGLLNLSQKEFGSLCGISTDRLSRIENHHIVMTWSQAVAIIGICNLNVHTKEYLYTKDIVPKEFYQYVQGLDESIPPVINVNIREEIIKG